MNKNKTDKLLFQCSICLLSFKKSDKFIQKYYFKYVLSPVFVKLKKIKKK